MPMTMKPMRVTPNGNIKPKHEKLVDNLISGQFKTKEAAAVSAGYTRKSVEAGVASRVLKTHAVDVYLKKLDKISRTKFRVGLQDKVMNTYMEGLDATRLFGKEGIEHPDWQARKSFADSFATFFGWIESEKSHPTQQNNQFNFFSVPKEEQEVFNNEFEQFLKQFYAQPQPTVIENQTLPPISVSD